MSSLYYSVRLGQPFHLELWQKFSPPGGSCISPHNLGAFSDACCLGSFQILPRVISILESDPDG